MRCGILTFSITVLFIAKLYAQESIPVGIVGLAEQTVSENPIIKRNLQTVNNFEGLYRIQRSAFDYRLFSAVSFNRSSQNLFRQDLRSNFTNGKLNMRSVLSSVGVAKRFRSGLNASWSANYNSLYDNNVLNRFNEEVGPDIKDHIVSSSLTLTQPLVRGRGKVLATALEQSSALNLQSASTNLTFANSLQVFEMAVSYWQYLTAFNSVIIYKENKERVSRVLDITQELVDGDKKPTGDLSQIRADLANQERLSKVAEQNLISARLNLGRVIGLSEEESQAIGKPIDDFPTIEGSGFLEGIDIELLKTLVRENRKDIEANLLSQQALKLQLRLADNDRKPQLDLLGTVNFGGMSMGNRWNDALNAFTHSDGRNFGFELGVRFEFPVNNNQAQGAFLRSKALLRDQEIAVDNLKRNIDLNVAMAANNIINTVSILENAKRSLSYYQEVYNNEQTKFHNGLTTLLNLILFQERLTFAQLEYLQARQQFAISIINLRYETGMLLFSESGDKVSPLISKNLFYTIPKL